MKLLPLWSLSKTPKIGAYALFSSSRTTLLLVSKKSDGRISHNPREKEDSLSLKTKRKWLLDIFYFFSLTVCFLCFVISFCFSFLSLSHFSSHPLFIFSFLFFPFLLSFSLSHFFLFFFSPHPISLCTFSFSLFLKHYTYGAKMRKFPPHLRQAKHVALHFSSFSFIS